MQSIAGLLEDHRLRPIHHLVRDLEATVGGQAVHENRVARGLSHQGGVHREGGKRGLALLRLGLLPHRGPDIGVDRAGPGHRLRRIVHELRGRRAHLLGIARGALGDQRIGLETLGRRDRHLDAQAGGADHQLVADVVPVAHVGELEAGRATRTVRAG